MHLALMGMAAFNLICSGSNLTGTWQETGFKDKVERPFTTVYRVDLAKKRWCSDKCLTTAPLNALSSAAITFRSDSIDDSRLFDAVAQFDRETGVYIRRLKVGASVDMDTGKCKLAQFTGFPRTDVLARRD